MERNFELILKLLSQLKGDLYENIDYQKLTNLIDTPDRIDCLLDRYMSNFGEDVGHISSSERAEMMEEMEKKFGYGTQSYEKAVEEQGAKLIEKTADGLSADFISRFIGMLLNSADGRRLYFALHKAEQIINRLDALDLFTEQKSYLKDDFLFSLENLMRSDFEKFRNSLNSQAHSDQYYRFGERVIQKSDFYLKIQKVSAYYNDKPLH